MRNLMSKIVPLLFIVLISVQLRAQDVAAITGVVSDPTDAVIPGATVTLENVQTGATYKAVTNEVGSYTINNVKPGPGYKLTIAHNGFKPTAITGLYLNVDATRTQNAHLALGNETQTVEVSATWKRSLWTRPMRQSGTISRSSFSTTCPSPTATAQRPSLLSSQEQPSTAP